MLLTTFKRVILIKSEDRNFDIWNVDVQVDEKYNRGFTRKVIRDAFGGGPQDCRHHWKPKPGKPGKTPFVTFERARNNALPISPGLDGMAFLDMTKCPIAPEPINVFVGEGINNWRLLGTYDYLHWGNIAAHHIPLLPREVRNINWAKDKLKAKDWLEKASEHLKPSNRIEHSSAGIMEALKDGRLEIPFSTLKCVGYPKDWFDKLLYYEKHPKPKKSKKSAMKLGKRERDHGSDSDGENDEVSDDGDEEYVDGGRQIAALPTRTSPRKKQRFQRVKA
ncbi:hypothetical protein MSAN_00179900 [Mycena sanguinolenta]|uniref:DUF6697 domain-containing protein n=1 Tax=Mycena sanguinolenta TaxID=230812 RepID=A0A8H6ZEM0_9AGAR|nr:hypothetical protein MSAN_00179900 [Mycena sanguinolenta]